MQTVDQVIEDMSIASRAMKAVFHRGMGATRRIRDEAAEALIKQNLGDEGQIVTRKVFTDKQSPIYKRSILANEMYQFHMKTTLPYGDDGSRVLPNGLYFEYTTEMRNFESRIQQLDYQILQNYPQLVQDDINRRNAGLAAQGKPQTAATQDYPDVNQMQRYLYVAWHLEPISTANDFRFGVDDVVKQRLQAHLVEIQENAKLDIYRQMLKPMKTFVEKLSVPIGQEGAIFRDSLVGNINEFLIRLPKLNIDNDPNIAALLQEIEAVVKPYVFNPDVLRQVPESRQAARDKMAELMKRFEGYNLGG